MKTLICNLLALLIMVPALTSADTKNSTKVYYRYFNDQGVKVLDSSIPPKYIRNGYEVVTVSGEVLRVVAAAPSEADAERIDRERKMKIEQDKADALIRRRYSNINDIDAVRKRSLLELKNNVDILQGNLSSTRIQIEQTEAQAAATERSGRAVSEDLLKLLIDLQAEERDIQLQIKQRELEYQSLSDKFDQDERRFKELMEEKN
jgi:hypothetical protein